MVGHAGVPRTGGLVVSFVGLVVLTLAAPPRAAAQDAHYWTYGYGPVGQLTEGALVGGVSDLSAVYYNPGALALMDEPRLVAGLNSADLSRIQVPDAAGPRLDFAASIFHLAPALLAGRVGPVDGRRDQFAYAFLARHDSDWDLRYSDSTVSGATAEGSAGIGRTRQRLLEYWMGGNWSHRVSRRLAFGSSVFLAFRAQRSRRTLTLEQSSAGEVETESVAKEYEYNHGRAFVRTGVAWRPGRWELGATVTTAGVALYNSGKCVYNAAVSGSETPLLAASTQTKLPARFHSPWSVAGGATWRGRRGAVHATAEWFQAVDPYAILSPEPATVAGRAETIDLTLTGAAKSVVNLAVGFETRLDERITFYGGAAHNASSWTPAAETLAAWDLRELTTGLTFDTGRALVAFGVGYAWGSGELPQTIAPPGIQGTLPSRQGSYSRWTASVSAALDRRPRH